MIKVTCIIPAYNEEKRIIPILDIATKHPLINEIIVVDDGSIDRTREIVSKYSNIKSIILPENKGKSYAIHTGFQAAQGEFVLFLDADLLGLDSQNISDLIYPIINNNADISISLRRNAPKMWHRIGFDYISGERVLRKEILNNKIDEILKIPKFGLEVFLNNIIIENNLRIKIVPWNNVDSPFKYKKYGIINGIFGDIKMILDIFRTVSIFGPIYQIIKMKKLIVK